LAGRSLSDICAILGVKELQEDVPSKVNVPTEDFFDYVFNSRSSSPTSTSSSSSPLSPGYYYFSDKLFNIHPQLVHDILPLIDIFSAKPSNSNDNHDDDHDNNLSDEESNEEKEASELAKKLEDVKMLLWMGTSGATTRLHYDWSYNFHLTIKGQKRFVLWAPDQQRNLYLYPYLHPRATKSQVLVDHRWEKLQQWKRHQGSVDDQANSEDSQLEDIKKRFPRYLQSSLVEVILLPFLTFQRLVISI
jgi:hypothetical protein